MAAPNEQQSALEKAVNKAWAKVIGWLKRLIQAGALGVILITVIEMYGINWFNISTLTLSQEGGIGMAGLGFLYSKL